MTTLGITTKIASAQDESAISRRYRLQDTAAELLPNEKVAMCMRCAAPIDPSQPGAGVHENIEIWSNPESGTAYASNVMVCDRVWICPICAAKISEQRREEIRVAYEHSGKHFVMATYTLSHNKYTPLKTTLDVLSEALRSMKSGRFWQDIKREYEWVGDIRTLEITYGRNGWHPHFHILMLFDRELTPHNLASLEAQLKKRWLHVLDKNGGSGNWDNALKVTSSHTEIAAYITKTGREPKDKPTWAEPEEATKGHMKTAKEGGKTPFQLLDDYSKGDARAGSLFVEYARVTKGRSQTWWSPKLREKIDLDTLLAEFGEEKVSEAELLCKIPRRRWYAVCRYRMRAELLEAAAAQKSGRVEKISYDAWRRWLKELRKRQRKR